MFEALVSGGGVLTQGFGNTAWATGCQCEWTCPNRGSRGASFHAGIDIAARPGAVLLAGGPGQVVQVGRVLEARCGGLGRFAVCIRTGPVGRPGSVDVWYGHALQALVGPGAFVKRGQAISRMGSIGCSTGTHVHFEVEPAGGGPPWAPSACNAIDPWAYVNGWPSGPVASKAPWLLAAGATALAAGVYLSRGRLGVLRASRRRKALTAEEIYRA